MTTLGVVGLLVIVLATALSIGWRLKLRAQATASARALLRQAIIDSVPGSEGDRRAIEELDRQAREDYGGKPSHQ